MSRLQTAQREMNTSPKASVYPVCPGRVLQTFLHQNQTVMKFKMLKNTFETFKKCALNASALSKIKGGNDNSGASTEEDTTAIVIQDIVDG